MFKTAFVVKLPSLAWSVKLAAVAPQSVMMFAVMVPAVFTMFETVTPLDGFGFVTVTTTPAAPLSVSATVAIVEFVAAEPFWRDNPFAAVIAGALFVPVPVRLMLNGVSSASLLARCSTAVLLPTAPGVKRTVKVVLPPAGSGVAGAEVTLKEEAFAPS